MQLGAYHTATITSGSNVIGLTYTVASTLFAIGDGVSGTGIPGGATITGLSPTNLTISANATGNGTTFTSPGIISYLCIGTTPNRVFTMQWKRQSRYSNNGTGIDDYINLQIKLHETTNIVDLIYGRCGTNNTNTQPSETGLVGSNNLDFNNRDVPAFVNWQTSSAGTANNVTCMFGINNTVPQNLTYRWTPPAPCSGTPAANTAVSSSSLACMGGNVNLNLSATYSLTGLIFVWSSASSLAGPYSPINTSSLSALTATNVTTNTWYICTITCTNSSQSYTTASIGVTSVGSITNTTPYFEGFESLQLNNSLPNCSWASSNPTNICQTYTSMASNNRYPNSGNKFAAFKFGTNTIGDYFYSNGIKLFAGITYSAEVFYVTDGGNGWSEFSMYYGASQSTTGLVNIATETSTANLTSMFYLPLTNTFVVPNSGYYYIAIKAIGNTTPWFLSWDDLSVTAPCNLNTPTLSITGGTLAQCAATPVKLTASGADTYNWSTGPLTSTVNVIQTINTSYTVSGFGPTGCLGTAMITVSVEPLPTVSITPLTQSICVSDVATITVNGALSYTWNPSNSFASSFTLSPAASNVYSVSYTGVNNCIATSTAQVDVSQCVGLNKLTVNTEIKIYPNPTQGIITICDSNAGTKTIEITDITGRVIQKKNVTGSICQVDLKEFSKGIYYLKITSETSTEITKVIRN